ncbi:MAG: 4-hydroxythreonine-4-phosphate dehydrogenase PdxA [Bacteroidetes bacterium]|nr:4-hydroxythreonine-4-phosphate dehydrogenase PdxA [Bacteroidota bacterium]
MREKIRVGITHGDINGIGYHVIIKTLQDPRVNEFCTPIVYGSPKVAAYHRKALNINNFSLNNIKRAEDANPKRSNIINCVDENIRVEFGKSTEAAGESSLLALQRAVEDLKNNRIDVLVTAPINKSNMPVKLFPYSGHTEYFEKEFDADGTVMLMISDIMKVGVVTGHIPLSEIPARLTTELILKKLHILNRSLINDFTIRKPRIAVTGLNPHAGEEGLLGTEEKEIIEPAIRKARDEGIMALGPYSADGLFGNPDFVRFDAILAMYHDQGLTPFKALCFNSGVNYTAGLPFVRTSPVHGTAFDLAGKNEASESSFRNALYMACDIYARSTENYELSKNPMKHYDIENIQ